MIPTPTIQDLKAARMVFEESEPSLPFYRAATGLMGLALRGETSLSVTEALAVLLQTWNRAFDRFTPFDSRHFAELEHVVTSNQKDLANLREVHRKLLQSRLGWLRGVLHVRMDAGSEEVVTSAWPPPARRRSVRWLVR